MVLLGPLLTFLTTLALFGQAQEDPPCVDLLQHQLHLESHELETTDIVSQASPDPSPALNVNVLSYQLWQGSVQITNNFAPAPAAPTPAPESSWSSSLKWSNAISATQSLAQNIQSCYSSSSSSCSGTQITSSFLGVASQVSELADVFVPEGTIIAGLGQLLLSLMGTRSSPESPAPMTPSSVVGAASLGDELAQCTAKTYSVNADVATNLQNVLINTQPPKPLFNMNTWKSMTKSIKSAQTQLMTYAEQCVQGIATSTFLTVGSDGVGSFSNQCTSMCNTKDAYNDNLGSCNSGANSFQSQFSHFVSNLQTFMTATEFFTTARSSLLATAKANGYPETHYIDYQSFVEDTQHLTSWMQWASAIQSGIIDKCGNGGNQNTLNGSVSYMNQLVANPNGFAAWPPGDTPTFQFTEYGFLFSSSQCGYCPNGWTTQGCSGTLGNVNTCASNTACMEVQNNPCYMAVNNISLAPPNSGEAPQTKYPINVTQIQHNATCVHHTSDAQLRSCNSSSSKHLFAVMSNQLLFPDMRAPISSTSAAYCFYGNQDGALDIGTGKQCTGWQFQHVASRGGNPKGTWPVQIVANGLCWTASGTSVVLSRCDTSSAQQIFVLVQM